MSRQTTVFLDRVSASVTSTGVVGPDLGTSGTLHFREKAVFPRLPRSPEQATKSVYGLAPDVRGRGQVERIFLISVDRSFESREDLGMSTETVTIDPKILSDAEAAIEAALSGTVLDPVIARRIQERAARVRLEISREQGVVNIGASAIREFRDR